MREERLQFLGCVTSVFDTPCDAPYTHARRSHDALCQDCLTTFYAPIQHRQNRREGTEGVSSFKLG